jgi:hypothetical protein
VVLHDLSEGRSLHRRRKGSDACVEHREVLEEQEREVPHPVDGGPAVFRTESAMS